MLSAWLIADNRRVYNAPPPSATVDGRNGCTLRESGTAEDETASSRGGSTRVPRRSILGESVTLAAPLPTLGGDNARSFAASCCACIVAVPQMLPGVFGTEYDPLIPGRAAGRKSACEPPTCVCPSPGTGADESLHVWLPLIPGAPKPGVATGVPKPICGMLALAP